MIRLRKLFGKVLMLINKSFYLEFNRGLLMKLGHIKLISTRSPRQLYRLRLLHHRQAEKHILLDLIEGSEYAFEEIYKFYSPGLFGRLLKLVKIEAQAQEILQDVFLKIWEQRKSIDPEKSFRSFLSKIAENQVYDFFLKVARDENLQSQLIVLATANHAIIESFMSGEENLAILQNAIADLHPQQQQVFRLCRLEGKSYKEVSGMLGISVSTISDQIEKATMVIREHIASKIIP